MQQNRDGSSEGWDLTELVCDNTQYDDAYWTEIESQIIFDDDSSYYIEGSSIYKRTEETGDAVALKTSDSGMLQMDQVHTIRSVIQDFLCTTMNCTIILQKRSVRLI